MTTTTRAIFRPDLSARPFRFTAERVMTAAPDALFRAWTEAIERWRPAAGSELMTPEVNGVFVFELVDEGSRFPHYGRFLRLERDRLVELTSLTGADGTKGAETVVTVELAPADGGTHLRLTHAGFPDQESPDGHEQAWPLGLEQQDRRLSAPR